MLQFDLVGWFVVFLADDIPQIPFSGICGGEKAAMKHGGEGPGVKTEAHKGWSSQRRGLTKKILFFPPCW